MKLLSRKVCSCVILMAIPSVVLAQSKKPIVDRFAGTWVENEAKRQGAPGFGNLRFRSTAAGGLEELRGPEVRPVVQPINFDSKTYHLAGSKNSIAWRQISPKKFERALFSENGQLLSTRRIQISQDGRTMTEETERKLPDGSTSTNTTSHERTSGDGSGLSGIWEVKSSRSSKPTRIVYKAVGSNALRVIDERFGNSDYTMTLDSKPVPVTGAAIIPNMMVAAKQIDDHTIETTQSREGTVAGTQKMTLSADGKVMTVTTMMVAAAGSREPTIRVFEKQ